MVEFTVRITERKGNIDFDFVTNIGGHVTQAEKDNEAAIHDLVKDTLYSVIARSTVLKKD